MNAARFVQILAKFESENVFNPYRDVCDVHDRKDASALRRRVLKSYLAAAEALGSDTIWMGRDLGYRGGRRTGIALTDECHLQELSKLYPGSEPTQSTKGPAVSERTAAEIWSILRRISLRPVLWNVFPFHPHEVDNPFSNRRFTARELSEAEELNRELIEWLGIRRIIAIGQDAAEYASRLGVTVFTVRHPSYGGVREFRESMCRLYNLPDVQVQAKQHALF